MPPFYYIFTPILAIAAINSHIAISSCTLTSRHDDSPSYSRGTGCASPFRPSPWFRPHSGSINQVKDGIYAKDKLSDYAIGIILWAKYIGMITAWEGTLFQVPWVKDMKLRVKVPHVGRPLLGPDGNFLTLMGRALQGASEGDLDKSNLTPDALLSHPGYANWVKRNLFAGRTPEATRYKRVRDADNVKDCDVYVNSIPYAPGPLSTPPAPVLGSSPEPVTKKKVAPRASLKADKPAFKGTRAPQADHEGETRGEDAG